MKNNESAVYSQAQDVWKSISTAPQLKDLIVELDFNKKLLHIFHTGEFYHYLFNVRKIEFDYISLEMPLMLGYPMEQLTVPFIISIIHPDDFPYFLAFEEKVVKFFNAMDKEKIVKYKVRYDYRLRKGNGDYMRILHQMLSIIPNESGMITTAFCVHTDITYLKNEGTPVLSFIGLEDEPSYVDVGGKPTFLASPERLTQREKEIIMLLSSGYTSKQIGAKLFISPATVTTHRKNILRKTGFASTPELVARAIAKGWI